jgi:hypothetical protein
MTDLPNSEDLSEYVGTFGIPLETELSKTCGFDPISDVIPTF